MGTNIVAHPCFVCVWLLTFSHQTILGKIGVLIAIKVPLLSESMVIAEPPPLMALLSPPINSLFPIKWIVPLYCRYAGYAGSSARVFICKLLSVTSISVPGFSSICKFSMYPEWPFIVQEPLTIIFTSEVGEPAASSMVNVWPSLSSITSSSSTLVT